MRRLLVCLGLLLSSAAHGQNIAKPGPLSPADERKAFRVPEGFEVQLVAAEPDIQKPIQIAFDAKGRLWVTTSYDYPFPAVKGKARDKLFVLSDFGPDGKAGKIETFTDTLNIPIGVLPLPDCKSCIVSECGRIIKLTDTNDDGKADKTEELFTGFGFEDTHGMTNSFLLMPDGWVYATHGFKNTSKVKAKDGSEITMNSGNTYRFKPDGSRIEIYTRGQVNPFGLTCDPYMNIYSADCHSKPITQLIRGAYYDSFGKPHDGLGYAPHVTKHDHGSTALCGLAWYDADHFPAEFQGQMFLGNVVTNRINRDKIVWKGSTPIAEEQPDFLTSSDPWFRPTDIKLGHDGALYFADFYNRIIGHYEVDLRHPQRDKDRGRVWRVIWKGKDGKAKPPASPRTNFLKAESEVVVKDLAHANIAVRLTAFHELVRRFSPTPTVEIPNSTETLVAFMPSATKLSTYVGMVFYLMERIKKPNLSADYENVMSQVGGKYMPMPDMKEFSGMMMRSLASRDVWTEKERNLVLAALKKFGASIRVQRAIVDGMAAHPHEDFVPPLVKIFAATPAEDTHLRHAAKIALRDCIAKDEKLTASSALLASDQKLFPLFVEIMMAIPTERAAQILLTHITKDEFPTAQRQNAAMHIGRRLGVLEWLAMLEKPRGEATVESHKEKMLLLQGFLRGAQAGGRPLPANTQAIFETVLAEGVSSNNAAVTAEAARAFRLWHSIARPKALTANSGVELAFQKFAASPTAPAEARLDAVECFSLLDPKAARPLLRELLTDARLPQSSRERVVAAVLTKPDAMDIASARAAFKTAPYPLSVAIGAGLAASPGGAEQLFEAITKGEAPARLLQEKIIRDRLRTAKVPDLDNQLKTLTQGLPTPDARLAGLIRARAAAFPKAKSDVALGKAVFVKNCAICHQIGGEGAKIGPQLDGIGIRGLDRLLEDTLDPNRNVDAAFRATTITTIDGRTLVGLVVREEGEVTVLADSTGKEVRIARKDVDARSTSLASAMPANLDTTIPEADYYHLLAYLLDQKPKAPPQK